LFQRWRLLAVSKDASTRVKHKLVSDEQKNHHREGNEDHMVCQDCLAVFGASGTDRHESDRGLHEESKDDDDDCPC
jgi:hypothetical protein